jgi:hypothetical protein
MRENFSIDRLIEYGTQALTDTAQVINPAWRALESQIRRLNGLLHREIATFGDIHLPADLAPPRWLSANNKRENFVNAYHFKRIGLGRWGARLFSLPSPPELPGIVPSAGGRPGGCSPA